MKQLFNFILKHHFIFLFLLLEAISFMLIFGKGYQRSVFLNATHSATSSINQTYRNITGYFSLRQANRELSHENARLREQLYLHRSSDTTIPPMHHDTAYSVIPAEVVSNSVQYRKNFILINKGEKSGIGSDMGVIAPEGVAGIVVFVSDNYSTAMSLANINFRVNAKIKKNDHLGTVRWDGKNYRTGLMTDIPTHVTLEPGDTIITSGNSLIFPEGILIGTVDEYLVRTGENFNKARIRFAADLNRLYYVYLIENVNRQEQLEASKVMSDE